MNAQPKLSCLFLMVSLGALTAAAETWTFRPDEASDGYHWYNAKNWLVLSQGWG